MNRLVIIGAGGHGKVIADNAVKNGYSEVCFIDDHAEGMCLGFPIIGTSASLEELNDGKTDFIIGIGSNQIRRKIAQRFNLPWISLIHPSAQIAIGVTIEPGTVVMAGAVINAAAKIGAHCIINTGAIVEHDNVLGDYVHISPGVALGGTVHIGTLTHLGIGATVRNNIDICCNCTVGAGAVVVKNIDCSGTYLGVPARSMNEKSIDSCQQ